MNHPRVAHYVVVHDTHYRYEHPVGLSRQILHLTPRATPFQVCGRSSLRVSPEPEGVTQRLDAFGNTQSQFCLETDHEALSVRAESWATVSERTYPADEATPAWELVRARLAYQAFRPVSPDDLDATRFLFESPRIRNKRELAAWAQWSFVSGAPILVGIRALMMRIHEEFAFDDEATTVSTPVMDVFESRRGVCQDFAHLMISCLRSIGLSARYVSGYLLTRPPPGRARLIGADASHAWVSVYCPGYGWIDVDPTNAVLPNLEHVTLAWGRDYEDVIPLRGVLLGGGGHDLEIKVTVLPLDEVELNIHKGAPA